MKKETQGQPRTIGSNQRLEEELGWKERIELKSLVTFCLGGLQGLTYQVDADCRKRIESMIAEVRKREKAVELKPTASNHAEAAPQSQN